MKKSLLLSCLVALCSFAFASTGKYKVDDAAVDQLFAQSQDISSSLVTGDLQVINLNGSASQVSASGQSVGGFLIRSFFCGWIALHRKYMGSDWGGIWWKYMCIPVASWVANVGDFFFVLFTGNSGLSKYKGNDKWFVWA